MSPPTRPHLFQLGHASSNYATPPNPSQTVAPAGKQTLKYRRQGDASLFKLPHPDACHAPIPATFVGFTACLEPSQVHSALRALAGTAIAPLQERPHPSYTRGPLSVPCALVIGKPPAEASTTKPGIPTCLPFLSQNRFILHESLPDCTSSLSVVYGQLCTRSEPQLGCQLRGMGLIFPHCLTSALGTVSGDGRWRLEGPVLIANDKAIDRSSR